MMRDRPGAAREERGAVGGAVYLRSSLPAHGLAAVSDSILFARFC